MRSPMMKSKGLKFLTGLAFVIAACIIAVAENGNEDSNQQEVSTTVAILDVNSAVNEDSNQQEASTTVAILDVNSAVNEDSKQKDVPVTQLISQTAQEGNEASEQKEEVSTDLEQRMLKTISIDFRNTPIEDVIRIMAEQANVNIIKSPNVTGNVTATLKDVPLAEALDNILTVHGYAYVASENMIRVAPVSEITEKSERLINRIYRITYADVKEVEKALQKFISKQGSVSSNTGTSHIIVTDAETKIKDIDTFIEEIDRITPQVLVEVRIYDITSTEGFDIGADWTAGRNNPITSSTNTDTLAIVDTVDTITPANTGTVTTDTDTTTKTTNTAWQKSDAGLAAAARGTASSYAYRKSKPFVGSEFDVLTGGTIRLGLLDSVNVELALNVLRTQVGAKLLANPRILVLDNEPAEFEIISEIPYTEVSTTGAGTDTQTVKFKDVGTKLKVTPHVTRDGMIRLNISPEFGVRVGSTTPPTVDTRKINTKALVKDGQTVVLGGLRKRTVTQTIKKIPLLGDVPLLGQFFSDVSEEVKTSELIVFLTPRIVVEPTLSPKELNGLEATEFSGPKVTYTGDEKAEGAEK